jgi:hypothetical protein
MTNQQDTEILFAREASMSSMSLGLGLTQLRKYDFVKPGFFYSSMFMITIGLERLMKLIVIYDHRIRNSGAFPDNNQLKHEYGHKIHDLFESAIKINSENNYSDEHSELLEDEIVNLIIEFLSEFARTSRYYNLDGLTGKPHQNKEPLNRWNEEINSIILSRHYKPRKMKMEQIDAISAQLEDITSVMLTSENGQGIRSIREFYTEGDKVPAKQKYSMYYIYVIARFLVNLLSCLETHGRFYPFLREYFYHLACTDRSYILSRKTWLPIGH